MSSSRSVNKGVPSITKYSIFLYFKGCDVLDFLEFQQFFSIIVQHDLRNPQQLEVVQD